MFTNFQLKGLSWRQTMLRWSAQGVAARGKAGLQIFAQMTALKMKSDLKANKGEKLLLMYHINPSF
jgi:hypothetical protein